MLGCIHACILERMHAYIQVRDELRLAEEATEAGLTAHEAGKDEL